MDSNHRPEKSHFVNKSFYYNGYLAFFLFLPACIFFAYLLWTRPPSEPALLVIILIILIFVSCVAVWYAFWGMHFKEIEIDWVTQTYHVKTGNVVRRKKTAGQFDAISGIAVRSYELSESTIWFAELTLDDKSFPIREFSSEQEAQDFVGSLSSNSAADTKS